MIGQKRVIRKMSFDKPPRPYYVIEMNVSAKGHYIQLDGIYGTRAAAIRAMKKT